MLIYHANNVWLICIPIPFIFTNRNIAFLHSPISLNFCVQVLFVLCLHCIPQAEMMYNFLQNKCKSIYCMLSLTLSYQSGRKVKRTTYSPFLAIA